MLSITAEPASLQATEMEKKNCIQKAVEQSKVMFTQAQQRLQGTLLKIVFLKGICKLFSFLRGYFLVLSRVWVMRKCQRKKKTTTLSEERKGGTQNSIL